MTSPRPYRRPLRVLPGAIVFALALVPLARFVHAFATRVDFPFDLEWIEGHMLAMATRVAQGGALYPEPSLDYIPAPYFPLYFLVTGALVKIFGAEFWTGRAVSFASTITLAGVIIYSVRARAGWYVGAAAAACYLSAYTLLRTFPDLFRVDAFAMLFLVAAFAVADPRGSTRRAAAAALILAIATFAKQNGLLFFPPLLFVFFVANRKNALVFAAVFAALVGAFVLAWQATSDGWFWRYTFQLVKGNVLDERVLGAHREILGEWPIPIALVVASVLWRFWRREWRCVFEDRWLAFFAAAYAVSYLFRIQAGGAGNSLMPVGAAAAIAGGVGVADLFRERAGATARERLSTPPAACVIAILLAAQIALQWSSYERATISPNEQKRAERLMERIDALDDAYYMPGHVLPRGDTFWIHEMSWRDFANSAWGRPIALRLAAELRERRVPYFIEERNRAAPALLRPMLDADYDRVERLPFVRMSAATRSSPGYLYRRR
ncbi:hypothetical protein K8I61_15255 [bacterium]|nr:hypothetical protein [bacterium]